MRSSPQEVLMNSGNAIEWAGEDSWASTLTDEDGDSSPEDHELLNSASPFVESIPESENSAQLVQFGYRYDALLFKLKYLFEGPSQSVHPDFHLEITEIRQN
jgi:hypothetical protein